MAEPEGSPKLLDVLETVADLVAVVDGTGVVADVRVPGGSLAGSALKLAPGLALESAVAPDSVAKVRKLLDPSDDRRAREINLLAADGTMVPVRLRPMPVDGVQVLVGRDLSGVEAGQQRLAREAIDAARAVEDARREAARYRHLFQAAAGALLVVDLASRKVIEANAAAGRLLGSDPAGSGFLRLFADAGEAERVLAGAGPAVLFLSGEAGGVRVAVEPVREGRRVLGLVMIDPAATVSANGTGAPANTAAGPADRAFDALPVPVLILDPGLKVLVANPAFLDLAQAVDGSALVGRPLGELMGRGPVDAQVLAANLREHGAIRGLATTVRTRHGGHIAVEASLARIAGTDSFVLAARELPAAPSDSPRGGMGGLAANGTSVVELIGRMPLKDIVRDSADVIEQLCIEAALDLTGGNRANAADLLGLSRQSLYTKLHRLGLFAPDSDGADGAGDDGP